MHCKKLYNQKVTRDLAVSLIKLKWFVAILMCRLLLKRSVGGSRKRPPGFLKMLVLLQLMLRERVVLPGPKLKCTEIKMNTRLVLQPFSVIGEFQLPIQFRRSMRLRRKWLYLHQADCAMGLTSPNVLL